jgi:hypothetical protein
MIFQKDILVFPVNLLGEGLGFVGDFVKPFECSSVAIETVI